MPNPDQKVVPIRPAETDEDRLTRQKAWLLELSEMLAADTSTKKIALALVLEMDDGSLVVNTNGWADDQRAQQYFLQFMRNHGWPA